MFTRRRCCCEEEGEGEPEEVEGCGCTEGALPLVLHLTDALGTIPLTNDSCGNGPDTWTGGRTVSGVTVRTDGIPCTTPATGTGTTAVKYVLFCPTEGINAGKFIISRTWRETSFGAGPTYAYLHCAYNTASAFCLEDLYDCGDALGATKLTVLGNVSCEPFSETPALAGGGGGGMPDPVGGGVTITE